MNWDEKERAESTRQMRKQIKISIDIAQRIYSLSFGDRPKWHHFIAYRAE